MTTTRLQAVSLTERIFTIDVIRGFALLGILLMNITSAGLSDLYDNGAIHFYNLNPGDYYTWFIGDIFVNGKMRCLFSMLFGAGIILFTEKKIEGVPTTAAYYRRMLWLFVFGLVDLFLVLWQGDILYAYALCGMLIFFCRKWKPGILLLIAAVFICVLGWFSNMDFSVGKERREGYLLAEQQLKEGKKLTPELDTARAKWLRKEKDFYPFSPYMKGEISKYLQETIVSRRGGFADTFVSQTTTALEELLVPDFYIDLLEALSAMLIGMALFKWGFFSGNYSLKKYGLIAVSSMLVALPLAWMITRWPHAHAAHQYKAYIDAHSFDLAVYDQIPRVLMAISFASLLIIVCKMQILKLLTNTFSAIGRMAFTNYMMQNIFYTVMFYGFTFNKYMAFTRIELYYMVLLIWMVQAIFSVWWLKHFEMGPLEWLWRGLTYMKFTRLNRRGSVTAETAK